MPGRRFSDFADELARMRQGNRSAAGGGVPAEAPMSVAELTQQIESAIKSGVPSPVLVRGEVSNFKLHSASGHIYFTLKDEQACIDCVMFRGDAAKVKFIPDDGMELLATGRVAVYPQRGRYQLYVSSLQPLGAGALEIAFRQLCEKLRAEGLFEAQRKKPLPPYPMRVALVTGANTAALQDILKVLGRFPWLQLLLYAVPVQGQHAAPAIAQAMQMLSVQAPGIGGVDVILLARGGGSIEDLWAFNEELVARAVAASPIPVVTGIGHEVDVSVADLVADYHAHTPTEAAQVITAQWRNAADLVDLSRVRMHRALRNRVSEAAQRLAAAAGHELFRRPADRVNQARQRVDDLQEGLIRSMQDRIAAAQERLESRDRGMERAGRARLRRAQSLLAPLELRLRQQSPVHLLAMGGERLRSLEQRLRQSLRVRILAETRQMAQLERQLQALGPQQVLARGYSITTLKKRGEILRSASQIRGGERLLTRLADGTVESLAEDPRQPTLF